MRTLSESHFSLAASLTRLGDDEIHLWIFPQSGDDPAARTDTPRCLRETLAAYLGIGMDELRIERNAAGKPYLLDHALQFNLSHSGGALLIGLSRAQPLGVDIEGGARRRPYLEIARRYFTVDETAALAMLPESALRSRFLELWSAKEAVLKAIGRGIAFGLDRVGFALDTAGATLELVHLADEAGIPSQWQVVRLSPQAGLTGAVAWRGPEMRLRAFVAADVRIAATIGVPQAS
jgi:4'-phosphopantetheinyl transferase